MKISSSNIGTASQPQAAKNYFPYTWAWDARGSSIGSSSADTVVIQSSGESGAVANHPNGIELTLWNDTYIDVYDEPSAAEGTSSGVLNRKDSYAGKYLHSVLSLPDLFYDSGQPVDKKLKSAGGSGFCGAMYWYNDTSNYVGSNHILDYKMTNGLSVIVHDMTVISDSGGGAQWGRVTHMNPESPVRLALYWGGESSAKQNKKIIYYGYVLSDRILYDIPTPIRTHVG